MARYNSVNSTGSIAGGNTISTPASGLLTTLTGTGIVTLPNPVLYTGSTQTFYNSTGAAITLSTPSGVFSGPGVGGAGTLSLPAGSILTVISDGANYIAQAWLGGAITTGGTATFNGTIAANPTNLSVSIQPTGTGVLTLSSGTTGSLDNVNVGATTQGTGKFSTLIATGVLSTTATTVATLGTGGTGALQVSGGASVAGIFNVGGKTYHADSVGIGTNNPGANLEVSGATGQNIYVTYVSGSQLRLKSDSGDSGVGTTGSTPLLFLINNAEKARIDTSGNVGIGTGSSIGAKLEVKGDATDNTTFNLNNNAGNIWKFWNDNGASGLNIQYNGTTKIIADINANVGIGTTVMNVYDAVASNRPLVVAKSDASTSNIGNTASITVSNLNTTTSNVSQINFAAITGANTNHFSSAIISAIHGARTNGQYPAGILTFSTSTALNNAPSEKMRIDSAGNVKLSASGTRILNSSGNPILSQSGSVLQVVTNYPSSGAVYTQAVASYAEITTAYRTSITPISTNSILILEWIGLIGGNNSSSISTMKFYDVTNNADVGLSGLSLGSRGIGHGSFRQVNTDVNDRDNIILRVVIPNSTTTARTYSIYHYSESSITKYFNATGTDNNGCSYVKWHFTITEISA